MGTFKDYHPLVQFIYFSAVIGFSMALMHPAFLGISFLSSFLYGIVLNGGKGFKQVLFWALPIVILTGLINPLLNHQGTTILSYLPSGNPITLESVLYGFSSAVMLVSVMSWFSCFNAVVTTEKLIFLFGKTLPALSLVLSMVLRFVPRFKTQLQTVSTAQAGIGLGTTDGSFPQKFRRGVKILSIMITWSLENAIETADSMKSRGYGLPGRTTFSNYRWTQRDGTLLTVILSLLGVVLLGSLMGKTGFQYFPKLQGTKDVAVILPYFLLCTFPLILEGRENSRWKHLQSKI